MSQIEISKVDGSIAIRKLNSDGITFTPYTYHPVQAIRSVFPVYDATLGVVNPNNSNKGTYPYDQKLQIIMQFNSENQTSEIFDIQDVSNQVGWTADKAGLEAALLDINGWIAPASGGVGASATEATLISVLNAIVAADQDLEILLVRDTVTGILYQQITNWETGTPVVTYKDVDGVLFVPVNPMEYLDASTVLSLILTENTAIKLATQGTDTKLTSAVRTHNTLNTIIGGTVAAGSIRGSVINIGDEDGDWNGTIIPAGVSIPWGDVANRDTYGAIAYDPTGAPGTTFIIEYTT